LNPTQSTLSTVRTLLKITRARRKLGLQPESANLHRELGQLYLEDGDPLKAAAATAAAARLGDDPAVQADLAGLYEQLEFVDRALSAYRTLAEVVPGNASVRQKIQELSGLNDDLAARMRWMSAHKRLTEKEDAKSAHPESCAEAQQAWQEQPFDGAVSPAALRRAAELFERSIDEKPDDMHAYAAAARIYEGLGEYSLAATAWRRGLAVSPGDRAAQDRARRLELLQELFAGTVPEERQAASLAEIGALYRRDAEPELAGRYFRRALEADGSDPRLWLALAESHADEGSYEAAVEVLDRVLQLAPDAEVLARANRRRGEIAPLISSFETE
jgi:tetratricopeptide (TPR) repeat protein